MDQLLIIASNDRFREHTKLISGQFPDFSIIIAINGEEGIDKLSTKLFDLIISKIYLA